MSNFKVLDGAFFSLQRLEDEIRTIGERIAGCERNLKMLNEEKVKTEKVIQDMQGFQQL